jgi:hypothetical protein
MEKFKFKLWTTVLTPVLHYIYKNRESEKEFDDIVESVSDDWASSFISGLEDAGWNKIKAAWNSDYINKHCKLLADMCDIANHYPLWDMISLSAYHKIRKYYGI